MDSFSSAAFPISWQFADTRSHLLPHHPKRGHPTISSGISMCPAKLSHILKQFFQAPNYCVWGEFFEQQVTKRSFSFLIKACGTTSCSGTCRALPPTEAPASIWYQPLLPQPFQRKLFNKMTKNTDVEIIKTRYTVTHD